MNKKILFVINDLGIGGAEKVFIKDANILMEKGNEVFFAILFGEDKDQKLISNLKIKKENIFFCRANKIYDFGALKRLSNFIKNKNIYVVYSTLNEANIFSRFLKIFNFKIKVFIREANVANQKPLKFKFLDIVLNIFVEKIVCVSEEVKESLYKYQPFYKKKIEVLVNGVNVPEVHKIYAGNIEIPIKILSVGSLTPQKGHKLLVEALFMVNKKYPNSFKATIVGSGVEKENIIQKISELNLVDKVSIIEPVSSEELSKYYIDSDLFVLSSLWEGCPNVLLEAMAHGLACVSTKVSGAKSIIGDGLSGKLVSIGSSDKLADAIVYMLENKNKFTIFGQNARKRAQNMFSNKKHIEKLQSILG